MAQSSPVEIARHASRLSIAWGVLLIIFGHVGDWFAISCRGSGLNGVIAWLIGSGGRGTPRARVSRARGRQHELEAAGVRKLRTCVSADT